jgi:hypothetical protein
MIEIMATVMLLIRHATGEKIGRPPNRISTLHLMFGWWSQHARHKLATCSPQARNIARNMYTMSGEEGGGRNMEKVLQHDVWILVATCSPQACSMFATNSQHRTQHVHYLRRGGKGAQHGKVFATWEKVFATWKKCSHMGKCARNMENVFST